MIQTTLTNLILYNLCGLLVVLGLLWVGRTVRTRLREHRRRRTRVVCNVCGHLFRNDSRDHDVECPACRRLVPRRQVLEI